MRSSAPDRDRSYIINAAIEAYLEVYRWQLPMPANLYRKLK
jgi:predicted transcriptional regulator